MEQCKKCHRYLCHGIKCTCSKYTYIAEESDGGFYGEGEMYGQTHEDVAEKIAMRWNSSYDHVNDEIFITVSDEKETIKFSVVPEPSIDYNINQID